MTQMHSQVMCKNIRIERRSLLVVAALLYIVAIAGAAPPQDSLSWNRFKLETTQKDGEETRRSFKKYQLNIQDRDVVNIPSGDEVQLMEAVKKVGVVSVAVDASLMTFQSYSRGVYYDTNCSSTKPNHAMLVVGYGSDAQAGDYWLVKNSWGESWGMQGYMKLARNRDNHCGVATVASYPVI